MENTYLPRVWTEEGYYYPVFSEFGIIYENKNLPFDEEHIKDLDWAFQFHFTGNDIDFVHILERPTGLKDRNGKLVYEGDTCKSVFSNIFYRIEWREGCFYGVNYKDDKVIGRIPMTNNFARIIEVINKRETNHG